MKNTKKITGLVGSYLNSSRNALSLLLTTSLVLAAVPSHAQRRFPSMPSVPTQTYHPPVQRNIPTPQPQYHPPSRPATPPPAAPVRPAEAQPRVPAQPMPQPQPSVPTTHVVPQPTPQTIPAISQSQVEHLNSTRANMRGINGKPLPPGEVTLRSYGAMTIKSQDGRQFGVRSNGTLSSYHDSEKSVSFNKQGRITSMHTASMDIRRSGDGRRMILSRSPSGGKVVNTGLHSGYVERRVAVNNRTFVERTVVINRRSESRLFLTNGFGRNVIVPPALFQPAFYGWAYFAWAAPVSFHFGWMDASWYVGNPYFAVSPMYPGASEWLADYAIGETMADADQLNADADSDVDAGSATTDSSDESEDQPEVLRSNAASAVTTEIKANLVEQVKLELANDNAEASDPKLDNFDMLPGALRTVNHIFIVANDFDVTTVDQKICGLQAGDMLQVTTPSTIEVGIVELRVASSKRTDCPSGIMVNVSVPDLQEMQNNFQAQIESGMETLRTAQGRNGLPNAPKDATSMPHPVVMVDPISPAAAGSALDQQRTEANQTEAQTVATAF